jgi:hypothetical protein
MYICDFKMRNFIVYFLTGLFLLFVVESRLNVKTLGMTIPVMFLITFLKEPTAEPDI